MACYYWHPDISVCLIWNAIYEIGDLKTATLSRLTLYCDKKIRNVTDLMYREGKGNWSRDWSSATASLPGPSPGGRSSWSWTRWRAQAARWLAHQQLHTASRRFFPRRQPACNKFVSDTVSQSKETWKNLRRFSTFTGEPGRFERRMRFVNDVWVRQEGAFCQ